MKMDSISMQSLLRIQHKKNIQDNSLALIALAISTNKATVVKTIIEGLEISDEVFNSYVQVYSTEDLLQKQDITLIERLGKTKISAPDDYSEITEKIIGHLNSLKGTSLSVTKDRIKLIESNMRKGSAVKDFFLVNLYYMHQWGKDPKMSKYVVPETLYNTKFQSRAETATAAFAKFEKFREEIKQVTNFFLKEYSLRVLNKVYDGKADVPVKFEEYDAISFWLEKGYSVQELNLVAYEAIHGWANNLQLAPYICITKVFDDKFPERLSWSKRRQVFSTCGTNSEAAIKSKNSLEEWANEDTAMQAACRVEPPKRAH